MILSYPTIFVNIAQRYSIIFLRMKKPACGAVPQTGIQHGHARFFIAAMSISCAAMQAAAKPMSVGA